MVALAGRSARIFWSGHSLTDQPIPGDLAAIARSRKIEVQWNRQYMSGSSIRDRTRGRDAPPGEAGWSGYRQGYSLEGEGLDVIEELRRPRTVGGGPYDALVITEIPWLMQQLLWQDSVRLLRHFHDRLIEGNPAGVTWFYEPWFHLDDKADPRRWIAYERAAAPAWRCIAAQVNRSLAAAGRPDRVRSLPASTALAALVERDGAPRYVEDSVHLTRTGSYYLALVSYCALFGDFPIGAWAPGELSPEHARALQTLAAEVVVRHAEANAEDPDRVLAEHLPSLRGSFNWLHWHYVCDARWRGELRWPHRQLRRLKYSALTRWRLRDGSAANPLRDSVVRDAGYWHSSP